MHRMVGWEGERGESGMSRPRHSPSAYFEGLLSTLLICKNTSNVGRIQRIKRIKRIRCMQHERCVTT